MSDPTQVTNNLHQIRTYIYNSICEHEQLEVGVYSMTENLLKRRQSPCGICFCLHGPRNVKFTAIWDLEANTLLFYGANGERLRKISLSHDATLIELRKAPS
jgi:hypothetical protein